MGDQSPIMQSDAKAMKIISTETNTFINTSQDHASKRSQTNKDRQLTSGRKQHKCKACEKFFVSASVLKLHTGEKPYQCKLCDKCFCQKHTLEIHMRTHTGEKPHQCRVCDKCFAKSGDLKKHMRIHTGDKPYQCKICDKCFTRSEHLIFTCVFTQERNLISAKSVMHILAPYPL